MNASLTTQSTIKILIVDTQKVVRETLSLYLASQQNFQVVGTAANGEIAMAKVAQLQPDVLIVNLEVPDISGTTIIEIIADNYPDIKTLVLSTYEEKTYIDQAISAGARGYLLKGTSPQDLIAAINKVHQGYFQLGKGLFDKLSLPSPPKARADYIKPVESLESQGKVSEEQSVFSATAQVVDLDRELEFISVSQHDATLMGELQQKVATLEAKKALIQQRYSKLQRKFSLLMASQIILAFVTLGCVSSLIKGNLEVVPNRANITGFSLLIKK